MAPKKTAIIASVVVLIVLACVMWLWISSDRAQKTPQKVLSEAAPRGKPRLILEARLDNGPWVKTTSVYPLTTQKVTLRVKKIPNANVRWFSIRPDTSTIYKNANHPWEKNPYKWIGFAKIRYHRKELVGFRDRWEIDPIGTSDSAHPVDTAASPTGFLSGLFSRKPTKPKPFGSFWFQVEVEHNGRFTRSYGIEDNDKRGLNPKVFRVSRRDGAGYLGYLTSFFNVPGLFGSIPYQSHNYIGVDCADVLVAAYGKWKHVRFRKDQCVASLVKSLPKVVHFDLRDGNPGPRITWGEQVRPGYLIAVRYVHARSYQHIGALTKDTNGNGYLDGEDLVLHAGPYPLHYSLLKEGKFDGHVAILKPDLARLACLDEGIGFFAWPALQRSRQDLHPRQFVSATALFACFLK